MNLKIRIQVKETINAFTQPQDSFVNSSVLSSKSKNISAAEGAIQTPAQYYPQLSPARLLAFDPDNAYLHVLLASSCHLQKKFQKAIQGYTRAIELQPEEIASFVNRGEIYLRSGKFIEAFDDLKRASELNIPDQDVFANRVRLFMQDIIRTKSSKTRLILSVRLL